MELWESNKELLRTLEEAVEFHNIPPISLPSLLCNMGKVTINGKTFQYTGTLTMINGRFFIDGKEVTDWKSLTKDQKRIDIKIEGDVERLQVDTCDNLYIEGNCNKVKTVSGYVEIGGNVDGDVESVNGGIEIQGNVSGDVRTVSGNIRHK